MTPQPGTQASSSINLYSRVAYLAQYQPSKIAIETPKERLTYGELDGLARRIASLLRARGVAPGDTVGVRLRDTPVHMAGFLAVVRLGAVILPLDWRGTRAEFDRVVAQFEPKAILNDDASVLDWAPAIVDVDASSGFDPDTGPVANGPKNAFGLTLTSGTTGLPKAMVITHVQTYARCTTRTLEGVFAANDRFLTTLPLAYPAGREHALTPLLLGATVVLFPTMFAPREFVDFVNANEITAFNLSPNMSRSILAWRGERDGLLMPNVRVMISTTGKLDPHERVALRRHVVPRLIDYYGSSGTGPIAMMTTEADAVEPSAVGRCALGVDVEIVTEEGVLVGQGEVGRIRVRGLAITNEMVGAEDPAGEGFRDGWYYPGDLGKFDDRGILHLVGRNADLIKRGGLMIHAQEVERAIREHPDVIDVAVVGIASTNLGQEVVAFMEVRNPIDPKEMIRQLRGKIAPYKIPSRYETVATLPRNPAGKIVKAKLTE